jgi:hypothetical protein
MLNMQDFTSRSGLDIFKPHYVENAQDVKFDTEIYISQYKNGISLYWAYKKSLYSPVNIAYIAREYIKFIDFFVDNFHKSYAEYKNRREKRVFKNSLAGLNVGG